MAVAQQFADDKEPASFAIFQARFHPTGNLVEQNGPLSGVRPVQKVSTKMGEGQKDWSTNNLVRDQQGMKVGATIRFYRRALINGNSLRVGLHTDKPAK